MTRIIFACKKTNRSGIIHAIQNHFLKLKQVINKLLQNFIYVNQIVNMRIQNG